MDNKDTEFKIPELEEEKFELCKTNEKAVLSEAFKLAVYVILNTETSHVEARKLYILINRLVTGEELTLIELNEISTFIDKKYGNLKEKGDDFIFDNIIIPETVQEHSLSAEGIIDIINEKIIIAKSELMIREGSTLFNIEETYLLDNGSKYFYINRNTNELIELNSNDITIDRDENLSYIINHGNKFLLAIPHKKFITWFTYDEMNISDKEVSYKKGNTFGSVIFKNAQEEKIEYSDVIEIGRGYFVKKENGKYDFRNLSPEENYIEKDYEEIYILSSGKHIAAKKGEMLEIYTISGDLIKTYNNKNGNIKFIGGALYKKKFYIMGKRLDY